MQKLKVLIICPFYHPNLGGVETHLELLSNYLDKKDCLVNVLTYRPLVTNVSEYKYLEKRGNLTIRRFWWVGGSFFDKTTPHPCLQFLYIVPGLLISSLCWMLKNHNRVQVIHAHGFSAAFITRVIGIFFPQKRKIVSVHFIYKKLEFGSVYSKVFKWVFLGFNKILLTSKQSEEEFFSIGLPKNKLTLTKLWIEKKNFIGQSKAKCREEVGLPKKAKLVVLFVGRIIKMKGIFNLLGAAKTLPKEIVFVLIGDGPDAELLRTESSGVDNFLYVGRVSKEQIPLYFTACDLLILPSLSEEAQPIVIMEALSFGRPVVVTNKGGAKDLIDKSVGFVINPEVKEIKKIIISCYNSPKQLLAMEDRAHDFFKKNFSDDNAKVIFDSYLND